MKHGKFESKNDLIWLQNLKGDIRPIHFFDSANARPITPAIPKAIPPVKATPTSPSETKRMQDINHKSKIKVTTT